MGGVGGGRNLINFLRPSEKWSSQKGEKEKNVSNGEQILLMCGMV